MCRRALKLLASAAIALVLAGCTSPGARARLARLESEAEADDAHIESLSARIEAFERSVDDVLVLYRRATTELEAAERRHAQAGRAGRAAADAHEAAAAEYEVAARNWRLVTIAILSAATWDYAGHLCGTRMTTGEYRQQLRKQGVDLRGLDADHGLPRSKGGADHPLNYRMIDASLNRSLGNDVLRKLLAHPTHLLRGAAVSALMRLRCSPGL